MSGENRVDPIRSIRFDKAATTKGTKATKESERSWSGNRLGSRATPRNGFARSHGGLHIAYTDDETPFFQKSGRNFRPEEARQSRLTGASL